MKRIIGLEYQLDGKSLNYWFCINKSATNRINNKKRIIMVVMVKGLDS